MIGHEWAVTLLRRGLASGRVAHAYLFCGPPQVGKTTLAVRLAQALNCGEPDPPCGQCGPCRKIWEGTHPDVRRVTGEGAGSSIKIGQIRDLQREAVLLPYEGQRRVFVLERIDLASIEAANSLLKTLEEPPGHVVLALTADHAEALPATVVSRCQRLDLRPVAQDRVEAALVSRGIEPGRARLLARLSGGRVGWALEASQDEALLARRQKGLDQLVELLSAGRVARLDFAAKTARDAAACRELVELWAVWWRDLLLLGSQGGEHLVNVDRQAELGALAGACDTAQAWAALQALQTTIGRLEANVNTRLALEGLVLNLPYLQALPA
ncbi:MAG: DNA polymerase III subunit delta' C-terminal domain-containing protein [Anaerolineae bacterium]